ncbi:hypothetical protein KA005_71085 [bacterium]|nr:hypothetical protein [bacterium]
MSYPDNCIRGISDPQYLLEGGTRVSLYLFNFQTPLSNNGWSKESINWMDDEKTLDFTLNQKKNGRLQFKVGAAILPRAAIDKINKFHCLTRPIRYERDPIENVNPYHGNLLLKDDTGKAEKTMIRSQLACACHPPVLREDK